MNELFEFEVFVALAVWASIFNWIPLLSYAPVISNYSPYGPG